MAGLLAALNRFADKEGIEIDSDELTALGLSDETAPVIPEADYTDLDISGTASGSIELFVDSELLSTKVKPTTDGLMWEPIIRTGTWAMRPGPRGQKKRVPLQVIAGRAKDARKQIGLQDIVDAFEDDAIQHVTVPLSHDNTLEENQGFIDKLKIVKAKVKNQKTKKDEEVSVLMGGYRITEPDTKGKMERGTYANRSAGLIYDYTDTERGKTWKVVLEHVAITNRPWITGMAAFGRKVMGAGDSLSLSLSAEEDPTESEYLSMLDTVANDVELVLLSDEVIWDQTGSPDWARQKINQQLSAVRTNRLAAERIKGNSDPYDSIPYFSCNDVQDGKALISQGYGDGELLWVAGYTVTDGKLELDDVENWTKARRAVVSDENREDVITPLSQESEPTPSPEDNLTGIKLAQHRRKTRGEAAPNNTPQEENDMTKLSAEVFAQLPPEAQKAIKDAEQEVATANARADQFSERLDRVQGTVQRNEVDNYIGKLKSMGLSEDKGWSGVLVKVRDMMLADDGEPALQSDKFSDTYSGGELSVTDVIKELFSAIEVGEDGKAKLGEQLAQPAEGEEDPSAAKEKGTNASQGAPGKPAGGPEDPEDDTLLSDEEIVAREVAKNPALASVQGLSQPAPAKA